MSERSLTRQSEAPRQEQEVIADRWVTERQVFELDVNGRLVPTVTDTQEKSISPSSL